MSRTHFDAIVIGAGPAGATAAILLAQYGWRIALVEKQLFPRRKVCGECIAAPNFPLLDALGIGDEVNQFAGPPLKKVAVFFGNQQAIAALPHYANSYHPYGRTLDRFHLDALLLQRARAVGVSLFQPFKCKSIGGSSGEYQCAIVRINTLEQQTLTAPVLIRAHGSWEHNLDLEEKPVNAHPSDLFAFKATLSGGELEEGLLPVFGMRGGYGGMVRGKDGVITLACCIQRNVLSNSRMITPGKAADVVRQLLQDSCSAIRTMMAKATLENNWLSIGPLRPGTHFPPKNAQPVFLIGNAAAEAHPIIGEGISMALQSAWLLCERLINCDDVLVNPSSALRVQRNYQSAWHNHFKYRLGYAAALAHTAMRPRYFDMALRIMKQYPDLMTYYARLSGKVTPPPISNSFLANVASQHQSLGPTFLVQPFIESPQ